MKAISRIFLSIVIAFLAGSSIRAQSPPDPDPPAFSVFSPNPFQLLQAQIEQPCPVNTIVYAPLQTMDQSNQLYRQQMCIDFYGNLIFNGNTSGGSGPVTVLGPFGTNTVIKACGVNVLCNSSMMDDGTNPVITASGFNSASSGYFNTYTVDTAGVTLALMDCRSGNNKAITCPAGTTSGVLGVANATVSSGGTVNNCWGSHCQVKEDATIASGDWAIPSPTVAGELHDSGLPTNGPCPDGSQAFFVTAGNTGAGSLVTIDLLTPDSSCEFNTGNGGSGNVKPAAQFSLAYYSAAGSSTTIAGLPPNPSAVPEVETSVNGTAPTLSPLGVALDNPTTTTITLSCTDAGRHKFITAAGAATVNLPQPGSCSSPNQPNATFEISENGAGGATLTPASGTIGKIGGSQGATLALNQGQTALLYTDTVTSGCSPNGCFDVVLVGGSSGLSFSLITSGTNNAAAMVLGTGSSLTTSGTGTNTANQVSGGPFNFGDCLTSATAGTGNATTSAGDAACNAASIPIIPFAPHQIVDGNYTVTTGDQNKTVIHPITTARTITLPQPSSGTGYALTGNNNTCTFNPTMTSCTVTITYTAGNGAVVSMGMFTGSGSASASAPTFSISDSTNAYSPVFTAQSWILVGGNINGAVWAWDMTGSAAGAVTITISCLSNCNQGSGTNRVNLTVEEYANFQGLDAISQVFGGGSGNVNAQVVTNQRNDIVVLFGENSVNCSVSNSPFILRQNSVNDGCISDTIAPTSGQQAYTLSIPGGNQGYGMLASFKSTNNLNFTNGFRFWWRNDTSAGGGTETFTPTSSTISSQYTTGAASIQFLPGELGDFITDGINWFVMIYGHGGPTTFSKYPSCAAALQGRIGEVTDDNTAVSWGATVTGGGSNKVGMHCNGTNWTIFSD